MSVGERGRPFCVISILSLSCARCGPGFSAAGQFTVVAAVLTLQFQRRRGELRPPHIGLLLAAEIAAMARVDDGPIAAIDSLLFLFPDFMHAYGRCAQRGKGLFLRGGPPFHAARPGFRVIIATLSKNQTAHCPFRRFRRCIGRGLEYGRNCGARGILRFVLLCRGTRGGIFRKGATFTGTWENFLNAH